MDESTSPLPVASISKRFTGGVIDFICCLIVTGIYAGLTGHGHAQGDTASFNLHDGPFFLALLICFVLLGLCEFFWGKTPGKFFCKMRVVRKDGGKITFAQAMIRNILRFIDGIAIYIVAWVFMLSTQKNQRIGDLAAKAVVIDDEKI